MYAHEEYGVSSDIFRPRTQGRALDFGFGQGELTHDLLAAGYEVVGFEVKEGIPPALQEDATNDRLQLFFKDRALLSNMNFDVIICREVLEHVPDAGETLLFLSSVLAPGGQLFCSIPTAWSEKFFTFFDKDWLRQSEHVRVISTVEMEKLARSAGLRITQRIPHSGKWFLFWLLLTPFGTKHVMGVPTKDTKLVKAAWAVVNGVSRFPLLRALVDRLVPKSATYVLEKEAGSTAV